MFIMDAGSALDGLYYTVKAFNVLNVKARKKL